MEDTPGCSLSGAASWRRRSFSESSGHLSSSCMMSPLCWRCIHTLGGGMAQKRNNRYHHHFCPGESLTFDTHFNNSGSPCKSLVPLMQPTWCWCSERARLSPLKSTHGYNPYKRCLQLPQPLCNSASQDRQPHVLVPSYVHCCRLIILLPHFTTSVHLDPRRLYLLFGPYFLSLL